MQLPSPSQLVLINLYPVKMIRGFKLLDVASSECSTGCQPCIVADPEPFIIADPDIKVCKMQCSV